MMTVTAGPFFERMLAVNLFIIAFNMIPAFPMDGGRVIRSVLALRTEHSRATQIAALFGQAIAVFFAVIGLFYNPFLLIIAFFVWIGASREARAAQMQSAVGGIPVQQAMLTDFRTLDKNDSLDRAIELTRAGYQKNFPVVDNGRIDWLKKSRERSI
jgi:fatty acid desaturase